MTTAPQGWVTFLFTDIEGSTRLWERAPEAMRQTLAWHDTLLHQFIAERQGVVFKTIGDAFCAAFATADAAIATAVAAQRALATLDFPEVGPLRVRMALHSGAPECRDGDYFGPPVNRVARLLSAGHGGQILLSETVAAGVAPALGDDLSLIDLGVHSLRDVSDPIHIWQLNVAGLPSHFAPLKTLDYDPTNVPAPLTSFVGRDVLLGELAAMLREPTVRLVTLTGPGGIGKTRLASQLAAQSREDFPDGRYLISLAPVADPDLVLDAITTALGVPEDPGASKEAALYAWLRLKRVLLILDNFEQVLDATPLVPSILRAAPHVRVLATSREALRVYGEHEVEVPVLALPDPARKLTPDELVAYDAIALFVQRAQSVRRTFTLTATNAPVIAAICQRLDGLPLAIELAAARCRLFSPQQMLQRLNDRLGFLTDGSRDLSERQQSLRAAIQWSYDLLSPPARSLFRRLSVFAGGMTLEAVTAVAGGEDADPLDMIDAVEALVDQSLLREAGAMDDEPRFMMLETLREFGREQLRANGEEEATQGRHAAWFVAYTADADQQLMGDGQQHWLNVLETEHDNLRAALDYSLDHDDATIALRIGATIWRFWSLRGHVAEGRAWLARALAAGDDAEPRIRARALFAAGMLAEDQNDLASAERLYAESARLAEEVNDDELAGRALDGLGNTAHDRGDYARAEDLHARALDRFRAAGNTRGQASALGNLGAIAFFRGDFAGADARWEECLRTMRAIGDLRSVGSLLSNLGASAVEQGELERGAALHGEAIAIQRPLGDKRSLAFSLINLGNVLRVRDKQVEALVLLDEAITLADEVGDVRTAGVARIGAGFASFTLGDHARAARELAAGITGLRKSEDAYQLANALEEVAAIATKGVDSAAGTRLFAAAERLREAIGAPEQGIDEQFVKQGIATARAELGDSCFDRVWSEGVQMDSDAAVAEALRVCTHLAGERLAALTLE